MSYDQIAWLPLCAGVTAVGLVAGFLAFRRRGASAGLRAVAWSLIPLAAYLTGALPTLWTIGAAAAGFVTGLVLSPMVWTGVALAGLSAVLFLVSGVLRRRGRRVVPAANSGRPGKHASPGTAAGAAPVQPDPGRLHAKPAAPAGDDLSDIEEILRRRGIS